ncbi:MAG: hypothetical protein EPO26_05395 [Chloroflexota bacterium]|nr:MAG: hypothetical protein EPO26_05395 [Chloroflexota bacterium]
MSDLANLWALQTLDSEIDAAESRVAKARAQRIVTPEVKVARLAAARATEAVAAAEKAQRDLDWNVADRTAKIQELDKKLYSGTIKSPKDLSGLQIEIQHMRGALEKTEQSLLEAMVAAEDLRAANEARKSELATTERQWKADIRGLDAAIAEATAAIATARPKRDAAAATIPAALLARYEDLRKRHHGVAVAHLDRGTCLGCRTDVPTAHVQSARTGHIVACSACGRILHAGG